MQTEYAQPLFKRPGRGLVPHHALLADAVRQKTVCSVLIVDANEIASQVLATTLAAAGYGVTAASDPWTGERALFDLKPDLILQSLTLPGSDCWELAARFRRISSIPIVGYAGVLPPETRGDQKLGFAGFLTKPFAPAHLVRSLPFYLWNKACPRPPGSRSS